MATATAKPSEKKSGGINGLIVLIGALVVSVLVFTFVFGDASHFTTPDKEAPKEGDYFGIIYKGGFIVPVLMTMLLTVFTFSIERFLTINKAKGTGSIETFLQKIKTFLANDDINSALAECNKQKGSVANVIQAGLKKYAEMEKVSDLEEEKKILAISKEIEEATALELPSLEQNLSFISTIATTATLVALLGTVLGMIRAFGALASSGTPDPGKLSAGISEALVNTAIGIGTSALAIIMYNVFTGMIDKLTYAIDEMGFSIAQSFASKKHSK
jgi:biopolymer transport protein ExbB